MTGINEFNEYIQQLLLTVGISQEYVNLTQRITMLVLMFVLAWIVELVCKKIITPVVQKVVSKTKTTWDDYILSEKMQESFCRTMPSLVIYLMLPVVLDGTGFLLTLCMKASKIYIVVALLRMISTFISGIKDASEESGKLKNHSLSSVFQLVKLIIFFLGGIIILSIVIDRSPISLIAGLGAAATILMLVFKDTIVGFVSGIQLTANDMLKKGDWIQMDKNGANGIVQDVNITTVKVQNWDNTITTISPFALMNESFKNWRNMQNGNGRLATPTLYIDMNSIKFITNEEKQKLVEKGIVKQEESNEDITNITVYQRIILNYLLNNKKIIAEDKYNCMVRQMPVGSQGLPVQLYFFLRDKKWENYERDKDEILSYAIVKLKDFGLRIYQLPMGSDFNKD